MGLAIAVIALTTGSLPTFASRSEFVRAFQAVPVDATKREVRNLLGNPSRVSAWKDKDKDGEDWEYGTGGGRHSLATLGTVQFINGKVEFLLGGTGAPPSPRIISEPELVAGMQFLYKLAPPSGMDAVDDPTTMLPAANYLILEGQDKALAILSEYSRVQWRDPGFWLEWLVRVAFTSNSRDGAFERYAGSDLDHSLSDWPTSPVKLVLDVPINYYRGVLMRGAVEPFYSYLHRNQASWVLRTKPLIPPDDPFQILPSVGGSKNWPFTERVPLGEADEYKAWDAVIDLIYPVYRPDWIHDRWKLGHAEMVRTYHETFLRGHYHWSTLLQRYAKRTER